MSIWAVLAAKQAVIATGFGAGLVPAIGTGSLDGFVIGAAMTGACFTALTAPGRARRRTAQAAAVSATGTAIAAFGGAASGAAGFRAVGAIDAEAAAATGPDGSDHADAARSALLRRYFLAAEQFEPNWNRQVPAAEQASGEDHSDSRQDGCAGDWAEEGQGVNGYRSRHRLGDGSPIRRPRQEGRRAAPKHAAPPSSFASRMTGIFSGLAVLSAARH